MKYELCKNVMNNKSKRTSFNELVQKTFDFSFEAWYQDGYWSESNIPYTLFDGTKAISNVSANVMDVIWQGDTYRYIQIGTVMTDVAYRNQGLSKFIMNEVIKDWKMKCDAMILFANETVLDFYPKLGFNKEQQYQYSIVVETTNEAAKKLDMTKLEDREFLKKYYSKKNPFSQLQVINNYGLLMFYCTSFMQDCIYYSEENDAVIIAQREENKIICFDVFCDTRKNFKSIMSSIATDESNTIILGFTPNKPENFQISVLSDDKDTLFSLNGKQNIFANNKLIFPKISHT